MQVLVGGDDGRGDFGPREQFPVIVGDEVRADLFPDQLQALGLDVGEADEVDLGMAGGDLAAEQSDAARADDREADAPGVLLGHAAPRRALPGASGVPGIAIPNLLISCSCNFATARNQETY